MTSCPNVNFLAIWPLPFSEDEISPSIPTSNRSGTDPCSSFLFVFSLHMPFSCKASEELLKSIACWRVRFRWILILVVLPAGWESLSSSFSSSLPSLTLESSPTAHFAFSSSSCFCFACFWCWLNRYCLLCAFFLWKSRRTCVFWKKD